ncbi:preprotein translocase, SecY subunit [Halobacteroides halobius DSM 5150]|uniref:Protein translocase subunit SecY n=1 Tax=Halobacteroides halobius (strain ATCC 35273 / DSM 5150 / MD-1) TaxID=748449 RepID=L0K6Q7_HALHC|nr:preprotein translocase subunit SecY [Halobacteroides halobius]AGB40220.1 preprotein translocase, SecY subunit [Halobacteroides halobius DSM 5150]
MLSALGNALKIEELRNKLFFVLAMIVVYRIGAHIPVPGIDAEVLGKLFEGSGVLGFLNMFAGGALKRFTIFAMSISPYITSSIILQLLTIVIPKLEELSKQGQEGKKIINRYTRYATVVLGLIQGTGITIMIKNYGAIANPSFFNLATIVITLTAGTIFLMWLGEQITDKGIGNGISIIIFASIISRFPTAVITTIKGLQAGTISIFNVLIFLAIAVLVIAAVIYIQEGQRKIPVRYSKRVVGNKVYGGQSTHIPMKVNQAGVIPVIFASSVLLFPATIARFIQQDWAQAIAQALSPGSALYIILYAVLIMFFTYFYTAIQFNPIEIADNMKQRGGFIPGRRPGRPTAEYLDKVLTRITLAGAIFLAIVAVLPNFIMGLTGIQARFGGTALLIVIGVALRTMKQIETYLLSRHYESFME